MILENFTTIKKDEKPLENLVTDGGYLSILREVVCIGDSLSSGEFEHIDENGVYTFHDYYDYSWGQFMARSAGIKVYNFSRGGMTAKEYIESFAENNDMFNEKIIPNAYIIALGLNDIFMIKQALGEINDINQNNDTFICYYAKIINKYLSFNPNAKFFFTTIFKEGCDDDEVTRLKLKHRELMYELTKIYKNSYVIDLYKYAPVVNQEFKEKFYLEGHMNPAGYRLAGILMSSYIDYIIRSDFKAFSQVGFIGTQYYKKSLE